MIDLHLHTNMSDGSDTPIELIENVKQASCKIFSVTDHDDLRANVVILSKIKHTKHNLRFITGTEISSVFEDRNLHLLCYGFDCGAKSVIDMCDEVARLRRNKILATFDHLHLKHGINIPDEYKAEILSRDIPGKVHIADAAMNLKLNMSRQEFFDKCLNDMESREYKISAHKVIDAVSKAGGFVSFAHPVEVQKEYGINFSEILEMSKRLKDEGLTAIEAYHSSHNERQVEEYKKIANSVKLLISGGSDYHGKNKNVKIGQLTAYEYIPDGCEITLIKVLLGA